MKYLSGVIIIFSFFNLLNQANAQICNNAGKGNAMPRDQSKLCAPSEVNWNIYYFGLDASRTNEVVIDWGDGSAPETASLVCLDPTGPPIMRKYETTATHIYPKGDGECIYQASVYLQVDGTACTESGQNQDVIVWDTDDVLGAGLATNVEEYEVCAGNSVTVTFTDVTQFTCLATDHDYNVGRWIQWEYGTANTITGDVEIDGDVKSLPYKENPVWLPKTETSSGVQTLDITVPNTSLTGEYFELTLHNWNSCNPYKDEFGVLTGNTPVSKTVYIRIVDAPAADFSVDVKPACVNNTIQFTNNSTPGFLYNWDFGDGTTSTATNPSKTYSAVGTYTVTLTVTNNTITGNTGTCITTVSKDIEILPQPVANFTIDPAAAQCNNTDVDLTNTSVNVPSGTTWKWEIRKFDPTSGQLVDLNGSNTGGYASTAQDVTTNLPYFGSAATATYYVKLIANTPNQCSNTSGWQTIVVKADVGTPSFSSPLLTRCQGSGTTQYTASANYADSFEWEITPAGAGTINSTGDVTWNATFAGTATVKITAKGCGTDKSKSVDVDVTPVVGDPTSITGDTEICQGTTSGSYTTSATNATSYTWAISGAGNTVSGTSSSATVTWDSGFVGTATLMVKAHGCDSESTPYSTDIEVKPTPQLSNSASDYNLTICSGETAEFIPASALSGSSFKWTTTVVGPVSGVTSTGNNQSIGTDKISDVLINSGTTAGTVTYHVIPYKNGCEGITKDFTVIVSPGKPDDAGTITGTDELCEKETGINFSVPTITNADDYVWTLPAGATISAGSNTKSITVDFTNTASGNCVISVYGENSCGAGASASFDIEIKPRPVLTATATDTEICHEEEAVVSLSSDITGTLFSWSVISKGTNITGGSDVNNSNATEIRQQLFNSGTTSQTLTYRITPTYNGCDGEYEDVTFTIHPSPDVTISPAATSICDGDETDITLSSSVSGTTYTWIATVTDPSSLTGASDGSGDEIKQILINSSTTPQTVKYTVTPSANGCDGSTQEVTITVQPTPGISATVAATTICSEEDTDISLSSNVTGTTYSWVVSTSNAGLTGAADGSGNTIQQTLENSTTTAQTATYTITPKINGCDGPSQDVTITVNPKPSLTVNAAASQLCSTEETDISLTSDVSGTSFDWTVTVSDPSKLSGAAAGTGASIQQTLTNTGNTAETVIYHITTETNSCAGEGKDITITVNPTPALTLTPVKTELCSGEAAEISFSSTVTGTTYTWTISVSDPSKLTGAFSGSGSSINQILTNSGTTQEQVTYSVTPTANGCAGPVQEVIITVNPPISDADAGVDDATCGLIYTMTAIPPAVGTGKWIKESGPGTVTFDDDTDPNAQVEVSTFGDYAFRWTLTHGSCGTDVDFVNLTFKDVPATSDISGQAEVCVNTQNVLYQVDYHTGSTYAWSMSPALDAPTVKFGGGINDNLISLDFSSDEWSGELIVSETNDGCTAAPKKITINSYQLPEVHAGNDQTICAGSSVALGDSPSASGGSGTYTYLWSPAIGLDDPNIANPTATPAFTRTYTLKVTDANTGCVSSMDEVTITVEPLLQAGSISGTQTICENSVPTAFTENPASGGDGSYTYQWQKSTDAGATYVDIPGADAALYEETSALTATTFYRRKVTGGVCGEKITTPIEVTVEPELLSGTIGSDQTIVAGSAPAKLTSLTDAEGGSSLQYQWQKATGTGTNYTNIPGATGAEYQPGPLSTTTFFKRVASGGVCDPVASNIVTVTVEASSEAGTIEDNQVICINSIPLPINEKDPAEGGTGTYSYRWSLSEDGSAFTIIPGETDIDYTPTAPLTVTTYYKREMKSGVAPWVSSNVITVTVEEELDAGIVVGDQTICQGGNPTPFTEDTAPSGGSGTYEYQWKQSASASGPFTDISGAIYPTYDVPAGLNSTTYYVREVSGSECVPRLSNVLEVFVEPTLTAGMIAGGQTICYDGDPAVFTSTADPTGGDGTYAYQWQEKIGSGTFVDIAGANQITYDVPDGIEYTTTYRRKVNSGTCAEAYSNEIKVTVEPTLYPGSIAGEQTVCENADPAEIISIAAPSGGAGTGTYVYRWKSSNDISGPYVDIPGAVFPAYDPPAGITETTYYVREVTSSSCGPLQSNIIAITIEPTLEAGTINGTTIICQGDTPAVFGSVAAASGGDGDFEYQWQWSYAQGGPYTDVVGANSETYQVPTSMNATTYYVRKVTAGVCGVQYSNEIKVTVEPTINPGSIGSAQTICENDIPAAFGQNTATGGSGLYDYQWQYAIDELGPFQNIAGATDATYAVADPMSETTFFRRKVSAGVCDEKYTNTIKITVQPTLTPGSVSIDQTIPENTAPMLFNEDAAPTGGSLTYQYQWKQADDMSGPYSIIYGANDPTYQAGNLSATTYFIREVSSGECAPKASLPITVIVEPASAAGAVGTNQVICEGSVPTQLNELAPASGGTGSYDYQWQSSTAPGGPFEDVGDELVEDPEAEELKFVQGLTTTTYFRRGAKSGVGDYVYTSPVQITVQEALSAGVIGAAVQTICYNSDPALFNEISPASGGSGLYYYQWKASTTPGGPYEDIPLATNKLFNEQAALTQTTYYIRQDSSGVCGTTLSNEIKVIVEPTLTAGEIGGNQTICKDSEAATLTEEEEPTGGTGTYEYQWKYATTPGGPYLIIADPGADQPTFDPGVLNQTTYFVRVVSSVGGVCAEQTSSEIAVIVQPTLQAGQIQLAGSNNKRICEGDVAEEIISADDASGGAGPGTYVYQWKYATESGGPYIDIPDATDATYNSPDTLTVNAYYRREVSSGVCDNANSNEVYFIVDPTLNPGTIGADQTIVIGGDPEEFEEIDPVSGGSGTYTFQWESTPDTVSANFSAIPGATSSDYYDVPPGLMQTTYYRRRVDAGVCGAAYSNLIKVTVESTLTSGTIGDDYVICEGSIPADLTELTAATGGNGVYTYQWKSSPDPSGPFEDVEGDLVEDPEAKILKFAQGLTQTTYFKREVHSGVYDPVITDDYVTIFVQPLLTAGSIVNVGVDEICFGEQAGRFEEENVPEGGDGSYEYQWLSSNQSGGPYQEIGSATDPDYQSPLGLASTTYYVRRVRSGECQEVFSNELAVIVHPLPDVSMTSSVPDNIICDGTEVTFTAAGADAYEFYLNGISVQGPSVNNTYITDSLVNMDEVYVVGTDANGCQALSNSIITIVNDLPTATIAGDANICGGSQTSLILNMTGKMPFEVVYTDDKNEFTLKNQAYESIINVNPSVSTTYSLVSVKDANGCSQHITDEKVVVNVGHAVAQFNVVGESTACSPNTLTFVNEQIQEGVTYTWVWSDGTQDDITTADDPAKIEHTFINYTSSRDMTYQVTLIATHDSIGCIDRVSTNVLVYPTPEIRVEYDPQVGCGPLLVNFINNSFGVEKHHWYYRVKGSKAVLDEKFSKSVSYILPNTTPEPLIYEVVYEASTEKCMAAPEIFEVTVYPELKPYFTVTPAEQHLPNSTVHITNQTNKGDWDYQWNFGDGTTSTERDPGEHTYGTYGQFYITLTVSKNGCEKQYEKQVIIDINPDLPFVEFHADTHVGCGPLEVTFTNESNYIDPATFQWDFGDGMGASGTEHPVHTYDRPGKYSVKLEAVNIFGERKLIMKEFLVEVYEQPRAIFSAGPPTVYLPDRPIGTINQSIEATAYEWDFGDGTTTDEFEPTHIYTKEGVYDVRLVAYNDWGCSDTLLIERLVSVKQPEAGKTRIPNSFTPDPSGSSGGNYQYGDVSNDIFIPIIDGITDMSMTIYNRWGKVMFFSDNKNVGWDGYYQGDLCPADVYYYKMEIKFSSGERRTEYGDVTLIR